MKVKIIGMAKRNSEDKQGRKVVYSNIFYTEDFDEYTKRLDYAPTGFERNGQPEFRLQSIDLVQIDTAVDKAAGKAADKK